jgi:hypothetical protein
MIDFILHVAPFCNDFERYFPYLYLVYERLLHSV